MRVNSIINNFIGVNTRNFMKQTKVEKEQNISFSGFNNISEDVIDLSYGFSSDKYNTIPVKNDVLWIADSTLEKMHSLAKTAKKELFEAKKIEPKSSGTHYEYDKNGSLKRAIDYIAGSPRIITEYLQKGSVNRIFVFDENENVERIELLNVDNQYSTTKVWLYENGQPSKYYPHCTFNKKGEEQGEYYIFKNDRPHSYVGSLISFEF